MHCRVCTLTHAHNVYRYVHMCICVFIRTCIRIWTHVGTYTQRHAYAHRYGAVADVAEGENEEGEPGAGAGVGAGVGVSVGGASASRAGRTLSVSSPLRASERKPSAAAAAAAAVPPPPPPPPLPHTLPPPSSQARASHANAGQEQVCMRACVCDKVIKLYTCPVWSSVIARMHV